MKSDQFFLRMGEVMVMLDRDGNFVALNPAAEKCYARPAADLLGRPFLTVLDPFSLNAPS